MYKAITTTAIIGLAMVFGLFSSANAQIDEGTTLRITVPEAFVVDNKTMPAGEYTIARADVGDESGMLVIHGNGQSVLVDTIGSESAAPAKESALVFDKVGGEMVLTSILIKGQSEGYTLLLSRSEHNAIDSGDTALN